MVDEAACSVGELLSSQLQCSELMLLFHSAGRNNNGGSLIDGCNSPNSRYSSLTTAAVQFLINRADGTVSRMLCVQQLTTANLHPYWAPFSPFVTQSRGPEMFPFSTRSW
jgi:hypothetical protein